jgi:predicted PurR-regulated permease PerM
MADAEARPSRDSERDREGQVPVVEMPDVRTIALATLALVSLIVLLHYARMLLIPIVFGILLSYVFGPAVTSMARHHIPRFVGAAIVLALLCGGVGAGVYTLSDEALAIVESVPDAARRLADRVKWQRRQRDGALQKVERAATEIEQAAQSASEPVKSVAGVPKVQVVEPPFNAREYLWSGGAGLMWFLGQTAMVLFLVYFLLVSGDLYKRKLVKIAGPTLTKKKITIQIMDEINTQISSFLRVTVLTSVIVAVATGVALWWFGVENYVVWGLLAGVFNSIPYLGPVVVTGGLGVVAFMQFDDLLRTGYVCAVALVITSLEGWLLTPALMSRAAQMNPVAIFVGLLFWSWVWGVWGTILAVPMLMTIKAVCDRVEDLQPIGELLGE